MGYYGVSLPTQDNRDVVVEEEDVSLQSVLLETVGGSEDVTVRDERTPAPGSLPSLAGAEVEEDGPGELVHLSVVSSHNSLLEETKLDSEEDEMLINVLYVDFGTLIGPFKRRFHPPNYYGQRIKM